MCDDIKCAKQTKPASGDNVGKQQTEGGKRTGIKDLKVCPQLDRTKWCQKLPRGHDEGACHETSQRRRKVLTLMKQLVDAHVDSPVCPEWDTSESCENTPGPYRFGVEKASKNNENYKIVASQMTTGCECIKRNGLQDECRLPRCKGSPSCRITPFPRCEPFLGIPSSTSGDTSAYQAFMSSGRQCKCPHTPSPGVHSGIQTSATPPTAGSPKESQRAPVLSEGQCLCVCR